MNSQRTVRALYFYGITFAAVIMILGGSVWAATGLTHTALPATRPTDSISKLAKTVIKVADEVVASNDDLTRELEQSAGGRMSFGKVTGTIDDAIDRQSRLAGINELLTGLVIAGVGFLLYKSHGQVVRIDPEKPTPAPPGPESTGVSTTRTTGAV